MRRIALLLPVLLLAVTVAPASVAAGQSVVPSFIQGLVQKRAGDLAYAPTRAPLHYRYRSFKVAPGTKEVTYTFARVRPVGGQPPFAVTIARYRRPLDTCSAGKTQTLQLAGNRVYWNGTVAWRCVPSRGGAVRISVTGNADPARFAARLAYGRVAASVRRIP